MHQDELNSGVLRIRAEAILTTLDSTSQEEVDFATNSILYTASQNGVFMRNGIILTVAWGLIIPPPYLQNANRYPFVNPVQPAPDGTIPSRVTKVGNITATITPYMVDGKVSKRSYNYKLKLLKVDPVHDLAILQIDEDSPYNGGCGCGSPTIVMKDTCKKGEGLVHGFCWAPCVEDGEEIRIIGSNTNSNFAVSFPTPTMRSTGNVAAAKYVDPSGHCQQQLTILDTGSLFYPTSGAAVVNKAGQLVGLQYLSPAGSSINNIILGNLAPPLQAIGQNAFPQGNLPHGTLIIGEGRCAAISLEILKKFVTNKYFVDGRTVSIDTNSYYEEDTLGRFSVEFHSALKIAWRMFQGSDYHILIDFNGLATTTTGGEYPILDAGVPIEGPADKPVSGVLVRSLAGNSSLAFLTPGVAEQGQNGLPAVLQDSEFNGLIAPGDNLTHIIYVGSDGKDYVFPINEYPHYHTPSQVMSNFTANSTIKLRFRQAGNPFDRFQTIIETVEKVPKPFEPSFNYPYSMAHRLGYIGGLITAFPIIDPTAYPNFTQYA